MRIVLALLSAVVVVLAGGAAAALWRYEQPLPALRPKLTFTMPTPVAGVAPSLPWPSAGAAAVGVVGLGIVGQSGPAQPAMPYSVTKVMVALVILQDRPLAAGQDGPTLTIAATDVADYRARLANGESVLPVRAGETVTERQALEAALIPSANNFAALLARWDAGSTDAMVTRMNAQAARLRMTQTTFADVAGVSTATVSTPADLVRLGEAAMAVPAFGAIVSEPGVTLPGVGIVASTDRALGQAGIVGIKTGSAPGGPANFLFAAMDTVQGRPVTIIGAVMGETALEAAFAAARALAGAVAAAVRLLHVVDAGQVVGEYDAPWGPRATVLTTASIDLWAWPGVTPVSDIQAGRVWAPLAEGAKVGSLAVSLGETSVTEDLVTGGSIYAPGRRWRLLRDDETLKTA